MRRRGTRAGDWENRRSGVKGLEWWEMNLRVSDLVGTARLGVRVTGKGDAARVRAAAKG